MRADFTVEVLEIDLELDCCLSLIDPSILARIQKMENELYEMLEFQMLSSVHNKLL